MSEIESSKPIEREQLENLGSLVTIKGSNCCLGFLMTFGERGVWDAEYGKVPVTPEEATVHNALLSSATIKGLDTTCAVGQGAYFYYSNFSLKTFIGEELILSELKLRKREVHFSRGPREFMLTTPPKGEELVFVKRTK